MQHYICKQDFFDAIGRKLKVCDEDCLNCYDYVELSSDELIGVIKVLQLLEKEQ